MKHPHQSGRAMHACPIGSPIGSINGSIAEPAQQSMLACPVRHRRDGRAVGRVLLIAALVHACPITVMATQQATPPGGGADAKPAEVAAAANAGLGGYRLPLLREGSAISRITGDLTQDPDEKLWLFRPTEPETGGLRREFALLPSPVLEDMLRTVRASGATVQFEMTGRVFIYRGRNFLLPDFAPSIMRFDAKPDETPKPIDGAATATTTAPNGEDKFVAPKDGGVGAREDAVVDEIERRLEERVGRAPQSRTGDARSGGTADGARTGASTRDAGEAPIANGTRITQRLGRLSRDPQAGSWRFVPEQATGSGDPSIEILPCMLLERMENAARENDAAPAIVLSGTVYAFEGRSYLLPSSFRRAREGRGIGR